MTMGAMRINKRLGWARLLVLGLLFLRALVPAGFMLAQVDSGFALVLCDGAMPAGEPQHQQQHQHQHHHHGNDSGAAHESAAAHDVAAVRNGAAGHDGAAPHGGMHGDPTCPYAQNAGPAPLPALPVVAATARSRPFSPPTAVTQTFSHFGPTREQTPRGPPSLA